MSGPTDPTNEREPYPRSAPAADNLSSGESTPGPPPPSEVASGEATPRAAPGFDHKGRVRRTRSSGVWVGLIGTALFFILLIIFIAQNSRQIELHFFGWKGQFSLALALLLSAVIGILVVAIPGSIRILQLRRALRKNVPSGKIN